MTTTQIKKNSFILLFVVVSFITIFFASTHSIAYAEELSDWTDIDVIVRNNVNEDTFVLPGEYKIDFNKKSYVVRISTQEINSKVHYFAIPGYSYYLNQSNFKLDGSYYTAEFSGLSQIELLITYVPNMFKVSFVDGLNNDLIMSTAVPFNGSFSPPEAPDHSTDGFIFVGWSSADYENIQGNCTIYALYEPARYVTIIFEDKTQDKYCVAKGSKLEDIELDGEYKFVTEDGEKIPSDTQVIEDMTIYAEKSTSINTTILICSIVGGVLILGLILFLTFK